MKSAKLYLLLLFAAFTATHAIAQNALINVLTQNAGIVQKGKTVFLEATVNNTDPLSFIGIYKLKVQISVPSAITSIAATGHILPTGWEIINNSGESITLSNGKNMIAASDARTLLIAIEGVKVGGPLTIIGQLSFSNGIAPGTAAGTLPGNNPGDDSSVSTCKVVQ